MNTTDLTLSALFSNKFFRIPDYQRGYAWGEMQLTDLWEDIEDIKDDKVAYRPHFTGTISLQKIEASQLSKLEQALIRDGHEFYNVVDGQQRLTTISILLFEVIKMLPKNKQKELIAQYLYKNQKPRVYRFSYSGTSNNNNLYLKKEIFEDANVGSARQNVYTNNLRNAKDFFHQRIKDLKKREIEQLYTKIVTALFFDVKYIDDNLDVQSVFETMNNRGKPLTTLEKLKNRLLFLTSKLPSSDDIQGLSDIINDSWGKVYEWLGTNVDSMLNEDEFLSAHLTLLRIPPDYVYSEQMAEQKVFRMFCSRSTQYNRSDTRGQQDNAEKEPAVNYDKIHDYAIDLENFVPYWYQAYFPDPKTSDGLRQLKIQLLNRSKEMKLFLAKLLSLKKTNQVKVSQCLELVEKIVFRDSIPGLSLMDERTFATKARQLHNKEISIDNLYVELSSLLETPCNTQSLIAGFRNLFNYQRGNIGFHRWSGLKYFLFEYEEHLRGKQLAHLTWEQYDVTSIEHIMPRTYADHWQNEMNTYLSGKSFSPEEEYKAKNILLNSLGNLTVIQDIKNSGLGNNPWTTKKAAYSNGCFSEIEISSKTAWDPWSSQSIFERGKDMIDILSGLLGTLSLISNQQQDDYVDVLFYEHKYLYGNQQTMPNVVVSGDISEDTQEAD